MESIKTKTLRTSMIVCSICFETINSCERIYSTKCGHLFHSRCLQKWMTNSSTCPECRQGISTDQNHRVFLNFNSPAAMKAEENAKMILNKVNRLNSYVRRAQFRLCGLKRTKEELQERINMTPAKKAKDSLKTVIFAYEDVTQYFEATLGDYGKMSTKIAKVIRNLNDFDNVKYVMETTPEEVDGIVGKATDHDLLAYKVAIMRKSLLEAQNDKAALENRLEACLRELASNKNKLKVAQSVNEAEGASNNEPEKRNKRKQKVTERRCKTGTFFVQFRKNYYPNIIKIFYIKRRL